MPQMAVRREPRPATIAAAVRDRLDRRDDLTAADVRQSALPAATAAKPAMSSLPHPSAASLLLILACAAGCDQRTSWVDVDASGCNEARISAMNRDRELVHQMGAVCAVNGKAATADRLRCHGNTLQVACRE
jgi:hypothetical protein